MKYFILFWFLLGTIGSSGQKCFINDLAENFSSYSLDTVPIKYNGMLKVLNNSDSECVHKSIINFNNIASSKEEVRCLNKIIEIAIIWDTGNQVSDSLKSKKLALLGANQKYLRNTEHAIENLKLALKLGLKYYKPTHEEIFKIYQNLGESYVLNGNHNKAIKYLDTAYVLIGKDSFHKRKSRSFKFYAMNYSHLGDAYLYEHYSNAYRAYLEKYKPNNLNKFDIDFATGLSRLKEFNSSNNILNQLKLRHPEITSNNLYHEIKAYNFSNLKEFEKALLHWKKISQLNSTSNDVSSKMEVLANQAMIYSVLNNNQKGLEVASHLEETALSIQSNHHLAKALRFKINFYFLKKEYSHAYQSFLEHETLVFENKKSNYPSFDVEIFHYELILKLLKALGTTGDKKFLLEGYQIIERVDSLIRLKIQNFTTDKSSTTQLGVKKDFYLEGIKICHLLHENSNESKYLLKATELIEQNKAIILLNNSMDKISSTNTENLELELMIKDSLEICKQQIDNTALNLITRLQAANNVHKLADKLIKLNKRDTLKFNDTFTTKNKLNNTNHDKLILLTDDTLIYRIFLSSNNQRLDLIKFSEKDQRILTNAITACNSPKHEMPIHDLEYLAELLLPEEILTSKSLLILPDGLLSNLPFEILRLNDKYLIENKNISYAYSLQHLDMMKKRKLANNNFTCFAPSYSDKQVYTSRNDNLGNLKYNIPEVEAINDFFPSATNYTSESATLDRFLSEAPNSNILHIAAHAKSDTTEAGCHIYFSDDSENYTLSLSDIYKMTIPAELVTLSACETATGEHLEGEGVLSLARGFAYAGAKSVVSSLWSANDQSTSMIMGSFYKYLSEGQRKDEALRQAKLDFLANTDSEYHHPYYWAAFIPVGDMSPIVKSNSNWLYGLAAMFLGLGGIGLRKKMSKAT